MVTARACKKSKRDSVMNIPSTTTDNISEVLAKIVDFTERRRQILASNIMNVEKSGFVPKDLDVEGFADLMAHAVSEHMHSKRLLLCDSETIKFGEGGSFEVVPVIDEEGQELFERDKEAYLHRQIDKLSENVVNNRLATELVFHLQQKDQLARHPE